MTEQATDATVGELTYRRVRSDIVLGRLSPGRKLTLDRMRDTYGTSISTLRELFNRLATEGLLVAEGSRGFHVTSVSPENLREIADMRQLLECHGIKESFTRGDIEWESGVVAAHHKLAAMERKMTGGDASRQETWRQYDRAFHVALLAACGSRVLLDTYTSNYDKYLRYLMITSPFRGQITVDEHRALLDSALARDWRSAQKTLTVHIQDCVTQMIATMNTRAIAS